MQMYKTFVSIGYRCFNNISQEDYYLNLEKIYIKEYNTFGSHQALAFKTLIECYNYQKVGIS